MCTSPISGYLGIKSSVEQIYFPLAPTIDIIVMLKNIPKTIKSTNKYGNTYLKAQGIRSFACQIKKVHIRIPLVSLKKLTNGKISIHISAVLQGNFYHPRELRDSIKGPNVRSTVVFHKCAISKPDLFSSIGSRT